MLALIRIALWKHVHIHDRKQFSACIRFSCEPTEL